MHLVRRSSIALVVSLLFVSAGCVGFMLGEEPLEYEAEEATAPTDNGFEQVEEREVTNDRTVPIGEGERTATRQIEVTSKAAVYSKTETINGERRDIASFVALSTPRVDVVEQDMNPVAQLEEDELLEFLVENVDTDQFGSVGDLEHTDTIDGEVLDQETEIHVFSATRIVEGREVEVRIYLTKVKHGEDYVVLVGGHTTLHPNERRTILGMMEDVDHDED